MESSICQMFWGVQNEWRFVRALDNREPYKTLSERILRALATAGPNQRLHGVRMAREEREVDGLLRDGYAITVEVSVGHVSTSHSDMGALEHRLESLLGVALLDLFGLIQVDSVTTQPWAALGGTDASALTEDQGA